ncbi:zinc metalloprotease HtpX [Thiotrichales bacterium 19S3-7]|nr:zinc metalloprotease HtpX [Thiotrichales bacterium 19S3-7]MCF6802883.1 zinc metalloprotease HtpX [Thiotrichales bacterium 19S3-11]
MIFEVQNTGNWRKVIRKNRSRTRWVIFLFLILFLCLGAAIDYGWSYFWVYYHYNVKLGFISVIQLFYDHGFIPYATIVTTLGAIIWVGLTFLFYHRIMLTGTKYQEINQNSQDPLAKKIFNVVEEMKIAANMNFMPRVYLIDADYLNAFASGYSEKNALIAITRALAEHLKRDELQAVLAHELTHIRNQDIKLNLFVAALSNMLMFILDFIYLSTASMAFRRTRSGNKSVNNGAAMLFLIAAILRAILPLITFVLRLFLSRSREYMADAGAVALMRNNEPLARALIKINESYQNTQLVKALNMQPNEPMRKASYIYNPNRASMHDENQSDIFSTHPSLSKRLKAIGIKLTKASSK